MAGIGVRPDLWGIAQAALEPELDGRAALRDAWPFDFFMRVFSWLNRDGPSTWSSI
ncbi:protein of unknown function [Hyphomicrobium sp. MC1]|nr:protein of unknown function [Hyphomicrobium sp. MC1]